MTPPYARSDTVAGTATGTLLTLFANIQSGDMVKTVVLSCLGACASFMLTVLLKWLARKMRRRRG